MVEVHPADKAKTEELAKRAGISLPVCAMDMSREGVELGYVLYTIDRDTIEIVALYSEEAPLEEDAEDELMDVDGDTEDFIEPAANPRYSLPEEELADTNAWEDAPAEEDAPLIWEPVPEESEAEEADADEPFETEEALVEEEPLSDSTAWEFDDTPADTVLEEDLQDISAEPEEEAPEAFSEEPDESAEAPAEKEADAEATEEVEEDNEPEFYIEPDAEGDRAPAPGYSDL